MLSIYQIDNKIDLDLLKRYKDVMNQWINYHHLFYFKTIAEQGSVSKAAEKLRLGQPTLSAQLKQFEDTLGVQLFERQHKKLVLTEQGKVALDYSQNIFKMGSEMYEVLHDRIKPLKPSLHLGALDSVSKQIVLQLVKKALRIAPCQITLSEGKSDELLRELTAHRMDLMVTNFLPSGTDSKGLYPKSITKKNVAIYGAPKFKTLRKDFPTSISGQPIILPTYDSKLRQDLDHLAKVNKLELNIIVESQDISVKKLMAVNELGLIFAANHSVTGQVLRGELIEIGKLQGVYEELFIVTAQRKIENPIAAKLRDSFIV
jgi:LysR family transcriptional regulator, transcriptional activator of nhaA